MSDPQLQQNAAPSESPVLILGAGRHIGLAIARRLVSRRQPVILSYHRHPKEVVQLEFDNPGLVRATLPLDARCPEALDRFFGRVGEHTDRLWGLIDCIGPIHYGPLTDLSDAEFDRLLQGNMTQFFGAATRAYPLLKANGAGRVLAFTFAGVERLGAYRRIAAYAAAKAGLLSLVRSFAVEWATDRITVNAIAPGVVARSEETPDDAPPSQQEPDPVTMRARIPMGRLATEGDILGAVDYLLSGQAAYVTGQNLAVAGGLGLMYP